MDVGVGSFVFSLGMVSALPLLRNQTQVSFPSRLVFATRRGAALLCLGLLRTILVKGVDYPVRSVSRFLANSHS
jgi:phosphatidylinositol glycan class W